ncbi:hypothetical protein PGR6_45410 [Pseudomonas sp. GR 6-02]|nr:hypothetical protein PGR6_45410 [Pseudomonas sp. GR 6-02]
MLIDDDQRRVCLKFHADFSHARPVNLPHFSIASCYRQAIKRKQDDLMPAITEKK